MRDISDQIDFSNLQVTWLCLPGFDPWIGKIPWRRKWQPTLVFLPGESHGWRSLVGYISPWGRKESDMTERLHFGFVWLVCWCVIYFAFSVSVISKILDIFRKVCCLYLSIALFSLIFLSTLWALVRCKIRSSTQIALFYFPSPAICLYYFNCLQWS